MSEGVSDWDTSPHILGRGRLHGAGLVDVVEVLIGAQPVLELVVSQEDRPVGQVILKGGELFGAEMGELEGLEALTALLRLQEGRYRLERGAQPEGPALGSMAALLAEMGLRSSGETLLLEGELGKSSNSSVTFAELFDVIGASKQLLEIAVASGPVPVGWLLMQAGHLLEVRVQGASSGSAEETFRALLRVHHDRFAVYRRESSRPHPPLCTLAALAELERTEPSRTDTPRTESPRTESPRTASPRTESPKPDPGRTSEPVRAEPVRAESGRSEARYPSFVHSLPPDEDTSDPPTYTPDPDAPARPPQPRGPRVVQPGTRQASNTDAGAGRRTPAMQQREHHPVRTATPRPVQRVAGAQGNSSTGGGGFRVDMVPPPAQKDPMERLSSQIEALQTRVSSQEDQELRLHIAQLREELARQGAQLEALSKDSSTSWWGVSLGIQLLTLLLAALLLALAWLP
jgi:hypothetical protein